MVVAASSTWVNPCKGKRWRTRGDGLIEVEGEGTPAYAPGNPVYGYLTQTWQNWAPQFRSASRRFGVPVEWLLSIATQETGFLASNPATQARVTSGDGYGSIGIMQPLAATAQMLGYRPADRYDPQLNIDMAAKLLAQQADANGFPVSAAKYNAGHPCNPGNDAFNTAGYKGKYVTSAIRGYNAAVLLGVGRESMPASVLAAGLLSAAAVFGVGYLVMRKR